MPYEQQAERSVHIWVSLTLEPLGPAGSGRCNGMDLITVAKRVVAHRCTHCMKNSQKEARGKMEELEVPRDIRLVKR